MTDELLYWAPQKKLGGGWICFKSSPKVPAAPDPAATAAAQTASNVQTAEANARLNRVNQYTPYGSLTYDTPTFDQTGYDKAMADYNSRTTGKNVFDAAQYLADNPDVAKAGVDPLQHYLQYGQSEGRNGYGYDPTKGNDTSVGPAPNRDDYMVRSSRITLDPSQQKLLDASNDISLQMAGLGKDQIAQVAAALRNPVDFSGAPSQVTNVQAGPLRTSAGYGKIQDDIDMSGVPALIGGDKLAEDLHTQRDSLYKQRTMFMDPEWDSRQKALENKLVQQGIVQGSEAWNQAMEGLGRQRTFDYEQARQAAITGGGTEQSRLFGLGLAANQNAYGQAANNAAFHNSAQQQGFSQDFANAQLNNSAQGQAFNQGLMNANLNNAGRTQSINEIMLQRQTPINELSALRTGSQVSTPQFAGAPQVNVAGTDVMSPINQAYQAQMGQYNADVAQNNSITKGLYGLGASYAGSSAGSAAISALLSSMF